MAGPVRANLWANWQLPASDSDGSERARGASWLAGGVVRRPLWVVVGRKPARSLVLPSGWLFLAGLHEAGIWHACWSRSAAWLLLSKLRSCACALGKNYLQSTCWPGTTNYR